MNESNDKKAHAEIREIKNSERNNNEILNKLFLLN